MLVSAMNLESLGWREYFAEQLDDPGLIPGRVVVTHREGYIVTTEAGNVTSPLSGNFRRDSELWPTTGDWVLLGSGGAIERVLQRQTLISRKTPGRAFDEQVLAANVDVLFVVAGLDLDFNPRRLERYLVLAQKGGVRPVLVLNKADLHSDLASAEQAVRSVSGGCPILAMSASEGWGVEALLGQVARNETAALAGSSGVGKSTIINRLLGQERQATQAVQEDSSRGRHTTTTRELIAMPQGWLLMDLPGIRELQMLAGEEVVKDTFEDVAAAAENCRFRDCSHTGEPGCAVAGLIPAERAEAFHKLRSEAAAVVRQTAVNADLAEKKRSTAFHKKKHGTQR